MAEELNPSEDRVADCEMLYRVVFDEDISRGENGAVVVGSQAFRDRYNRPSVDRAHLRNFNPRLARDTFGEDRGVIVIFAHEVRAISPLDAYDPKGNPIEGPQIDVEPKPVNEPDLPLNPAHAEIFGTPAIKKDNLFKRLNVRLSRIAEKHPELILWPLE